MKSRLIIGLCLVAGSIHLEAQNLSRDKGQPIRPPIFFPIPPRHIPILPPPMIKVPVNETPIELQKIDIQVRVNGLETETSTTMTFRNPNARVLEGNLELPLPSDASVSGYALDVNGTLVDGVIVPKEKARVVLETEIRKGVDPGILEHVAGNFFRTRIYPIPAMGTRTVRIVSVAPLSLAKGDAAMHIPLPRSAKVAEMSLEIKVTKGDKKPEIGGFGNLTFSEWNNEWVAKAKLNNVTPDNDLFVNLPKLPDQVVGIEQFEDEFYASISDAPKYNLKNESVAPQKIKVAWDASGSRDPASVKKDREFLSGLFNAWKNLSVELVVFRNQVEPTQVFTVKNGEAAELFAVLDKLAYDGGTNISALKLKKGTGASSEPWFLFTDGFETMKEEIPNFDSVPVHVISSSTSRNISLLRFLSEATGGVFVDLATLDSATALQALVQPTLTLLRVENPAGDVDEIQSRFQPGSGRANVYAKFKKETSLQLVYGLNGREILRSHVKLQKNGAPKGQMIARAWAASRAMELAVFAEKNEKELVDLGRKYHLVTPGTSLIVLERVDQYVTYEIEPPKNMPQWREQYFASLKSHQLNKTQQEKSKIETVLAWWKDRIQWWEKKYEYPKDFKVSSGPMHKGGAFGSAPPPEGAAMNESIAQMDVAAEGSSFGSFSGAGNKSAAQAGRGSSAQDVSKKQSKGNSTEDGEGSQSALITIKEWSPTTPYLTEIKSKPLKEAYQSYLTQRASYSTSPAFFLDCANYFFKND
ncbi:MAG: VIT domain-containing protein, partial [Pseudobdellovibrionaceae bacterium]